MFSENNVCARIIGIFCAYTLIQFQTIYSYKIYLQFWTADQTLIFLAMAPSTYLLLFGDIFSIQTIGKRLSLKRSAEAVAEL